MTNLIARRMNVRVKHGTFVERPAEEVFSFLADVDNHPKWQSALFRVEEKENVSNGQLRVNSQVRQAWNVLGKAYEVDWQVIDYQPGRKITCEVVEDAPVYWQMTFEVEPVNGGTFLTGDGGGDLGDLGIPAVAVGRSCQHLLENDLATLRDILEVRD
jgi:hypothetical protein